MTADVINLRKGTPPMTQVEHCLQALANAIIALEEIPANVLMHYSSYDPDSRSRIGITHELDAAVKRLKGQTVKVQTFRAASSIQNVTIS
ncbi:hypothetical protein [Zavarzinella formosa]|uniref:hypothetical protein n=1 Tax=Zavarzinella formosa TaxID=360055 RepID=UPI0003159229|nr:hypothetical protein [Zavarzinella formosa]